MTDAEIIKALKNLHDEAHKGYMENLEHNGPRDTSHEEYIDLMSATLDLIQRQQERFDRIVEQLEEKIEENPYCSLANYRAGLFEAIEIVKGVQNENL